MKLKLFINGKFVGFGGADDLMALQAENPAAKVTAEKVTPHNYCVREGW